MAGLNSTDFPHGDTRFPHAVETLIDQQLPEVALKKILGDNSAELYEFYS